MTGRPKGSKDSYKRDYKMSASAYNQRVNAAISHYGKDSSKLFQAIIKRQDLSDEQQKILEEEKLKIWKRFDAPSLMLMDEYAQFKTLINAKLLKGDDPTSKDMRECLKLLLDISKELNRLEAIPKSQKFEAFTKKFQDESDLVIEVEPESVR